MRHAREMHHYPGRDRIKSECLLTCGGVRSHERGTSSSFAPGTWGGVGGLGGIGHHESSSFAPGRGGGVGWWRGYLVLGPSNWYEVRLGGVE